MFKYLEPWERKWGMICLLVPASVIALEFAYSCFTDHHQQLLSVAVELSCGLIGAVIILVLQRMHRKRELESQYLGIAGPYVRKDIGQDNTPEGNLDAMQKENVGLEIELRYLGGNAFGITANYWKSGGCVVEAHVEFIESNKMVATGRYRYEPKTGCDCSGDFGTYTVYRVQEDDRKLLVLYQHVFPRKQAKNPDANRGWEIWERL